LCVTLPFLAIPGVMEQVFSNAEITYTSLVPRAGVFSPSLSAQVNKRCEVPLLPLHFKLVEAYWSLSFPWRAWIWLEDDFATLRGYGFHFLRGSISKYRKIVESAAGQFADALEALTKRQMADAIGVYGRGHWTMNSAALVAERLALPLYVVERGILPNTYIVDRSIPFTSVKSCFRSAWELFRTVEDWEQVDSIGWTESRWQLYLNLGRQRQPAPTGQNFGILIGQCMFDHNCLRAPFANSLEFIEQTIQGMSGSQGAGSLFYRPHPLSPEDYPTSTIQTQFGPIKVDASDPWQIFRAEPTLYTWNSTLGLEGALIFGLEVNIADPRCHYNWILGCTPTDKRKYTVFLNEISILAGAASR
jgi:hypothetical protein